MLHEPDFTEVQDSIEPGTYSARIVGAESGEWTKEDRVTKFVKWTLETFNEADPKNNGRKLFHRTPIQGKAAFLMRDLYRAAMGSDPKGAFDDEMLLGKEIQVTVVDGVNRQTKEPTGYTEISKVKSI